MKMQKMIFIIYHKQNSDESFINFGNALKGAVDIISEAYKEREKLQVYQQDLKI